MVGARGFESWRFAPSGANPTGILPPGRARNASTLFGCYLELLECGDRARGEPPLLGFGTYTSNRVVMAWARGAAGGGRALS